ncbi:uncharacterized protein LODBEIA_P39570 [Lodderomyces beijingensis]|uniref:Protein AFG1 n=1 Tax=Lodderomyces beijingensis TaxID=1775926 RepID=A0ABP0ZNJ4_9ASCO
MKFVTLNTVAHFRTIFASSTSIVSSASCLTLLERRKFTTSAGTTNESSPSSTTATATTPPFVNTDNKSPLELYDYRVAQGRLRDDPYQRKIITSLSQLHQLLSQYTPPHVAIPTAAPSPSKFSIGKVFSSFFGKNGGANGHDKTEIDFERDYENVDGVKGIYLYGDVGCGKTMLMDLFYQTIPGRIPKMRVHFHQFMQKVHKRTHQLKMKYKNKTGHDDVDVIPILAAEIANQATVLCFDEFQVTDVADAMLLRRLLMMLLSPQYGVVLFATSNRAPDDLYLNGIQRVSFIPCIQLIKHKCRVIYLNSPTDYRKISKPTSPVYYFPKPGVKWDSKINQANCRKHVESWYEYFNADNEEQGNVAKLTDFSLDVWGRKLHIPVSSPPNVAQFTFFELCGTPMAAGDYLTLAESLQSFIITDIPFLSINERNQIRRFITFLDAVYDARGRLAVTAAAPFKDLFVEPEQLSSSGDHYELLYKSKPKTEEKLTTTKNKKKKKEAVVEESDDDEDDELVTKHGFDKSIAKKASLFVANDEEKFAFARALSRLSQMSTTEWIDQN